MIDRGMRRPLGIGAAVLVPCSHFRVPIFNSGSRPQLDQPIQRQALGINTRLLPPSASFLFNSSLQYTTKILGFKQLQLLHSSQNYSTYFNGQLEPHMATIEGKVVLFGHELDMSEKHILYVCIAKATLHDRGLLRPYTSDQIRTVIQRMVAWKRPHVIRTKAYMEKLKNSEIIDQLIQELRDPHNLTTRKLADGVEKDLDGYLEKVSQLYEPHKAAIERKVVLFGHELDMHEKQILYVCIAKATLSDGSSKRLYRENEIYIVIQGMVNLKDPGVYNTKAFEEKPKNSRIIRQLTKELRDTRNLTTLRQADRVEKDLNGHLEEVSQLYRLATGPASFRQVGRMENLMINGKLLDHHHLAVLYLASKATLSPSGRPFSMEQIMGMVGIMLRLTGDSGFQKRNVGEYVDVFRNDKDHWVTKVVLDYLQEEKGQQRQEKAPEHVEHLFKQSLRLPLKLFPSNFTAQTKISFPIP